MIKDLKRPLDSKHFSAKNMKRGLALLLAATTLLTTAPTDMLTLNVKAAGIPYTIDSGTQTNVEQFMGSSIHTGLTSGNYVKITGASVIVDVYEGDTITGTATATWATGSQTSNPGSVNNPATRMMMMDEEEEETETPESTPAPETPVEGGDAPVVEGTPETPEPVETPESVETPVPVEAPVVEPTEPVASIVETDFNTVGAAALLPVQKTLTVTFPNPIYIEADENLDLVFTLTSSYEAITYYDGYGITYTVETPSAGTITLSAENNQTTLAIDGTVKQSVNVTAISASGSAPALSTTDTDKIAITNQTSTGLTTTATVTAKAEGQATITAKYGTTTQSLAINVVNIASGADVTYDGSALEKVYTLTCNGSPLVENSDYKVIYANNINAGTANVSFKGVSGSVYSGLNYSTTFDIAKKTITSSMFTGVIYAIDSKGPVVTSVSGALDGAKNLKKDTDFTATAVKTGVSGGKNQYKVTITGINNYEGTFDINNVDGSSGTTELEDVVYAQLSREYYPYTGKDVKNFVKENVEFFSTDGTALSDFGSETNVIYEFTDDEGGIDIAGTGVKHLTIKGTGSYSGTLETLDFSIEQNSIGNDDSSPIISVDKATNGDKAYGYVYATLSKAGQDSNGNYAYGSSSLPPTVQLYVNTQTDNSTVSDKTTAPYMAISPSAYTVTYDATPQAIGDHTITITGNGSSGYIGTTTLPYTVLGNFASNATVTVGSTKYVATAANPNSGYQIAYNGSDRKPTVTVSMGKSTLIQGVDYDVVYTDSRGGDGVCKNAGTATIRLTPKGKYAGQGDVEVNFVIKPKALSGTVSITKSGVKWDTTAHELNDGDYSIKLSNGTVLNSEASGNAYPDYKLKSYSDNINAGKCTVTFEGMNNYSGTVTGSFDIAPLDVTDSSITVDYEDVTNKYVKILPYTGEPLTPVPTVRISGKDITNTGALSFTYSNNTEKGEATINIKGSGNLTGTRSEKFKITESTLAGLISSVTVGGQPAEKQADGTYLATYNVSYTGAAKKPAVILKNGAKTLVEGTDYTLAYSDNVDAGIATIDVTGLGNYVGSNLTIKFKINPRNIVNRIYAYRISDDSDFNQGDSVKSTETVNIGENTYIAPAVVGSSDLDLYLVYYAPGVRVTRLVKDADYEIKSVTGGTYAGEDNHIIFEGKGNYSGTFDLQYTIGTKLTSANASLKLVHPTTNVEYTKSGSVYQVEYLGAGASATDKSKRPVPVISITEGGVTTDVNLITRYDLYDYVVNGAASNSDPTGYAAGSTVSIAASSTTENKDYYIPTNAPIVASYTVTRLSLESATVEDKRNIDKGITNGKFKNGASEINFIDELKGDPLDPAKVTGYQINYVYDKTTIDVKDAFKIKYNGSYLAYDTDYTLNVDTVGPNANEAGINVTATGKGSFSGTLDIKFVIHKYDISNVLDTYQIGTNGAPADTTNSYIGKSFDFPLKNEAGLIADASDTYKYNIGGGEYRYFVKGNDAQQRILLNILPAVTYSKTGMTAPVLYGYDRGIPDGSNWYQTLSGEVNSATANNYNVVSTSAKKDDGGIRAYYEITTTDRTNYKGTYYVSYWVVSQNVDDVIKSGELKGAINGAEINTDGKPYYWYNGVARKPEPTVTFTGLDAPLVKGIDYTLSYTEDTDIAPGKKEIVITMLAGNAAGLETGSTATLLTYDIVGNLSSEWFRANYPASGELLELGTDGKVSEFSTLKTIVSSHSSDNYIYVQRKEGDTSWHDVTDTSGIELKIFDRNNNAVTDVTTNDVGYCTVRLQGSYAAATNVSPGTYYYGSYQISSNTNDAMKKVKIVGDLSQNYIDVSFTDDPLKFRDQSRDIQYPKIKCNGFTLTQGKDYAIVRLDGYDYKAAGVQKFRITSYLNGEFFGLTSRDAQYTIVYDLVEANVTVNKDFQYDGNAHELAAGDLEVKIGNQVLNFGNDFTISNYEKNVNAGTASAVLQPVTGKSINSKAITFKIKGNDLNPAWLLAGSNGQKHEYDGNIWTPSGIVLNNGSRDLVRNVDYTIVWDNPNSRNRGTYGFKIVGAGNFTGEIDNLTYEITPKDISTIDPATIKVQNAVYGGYNTSQNSGSEYYVHPEISIDGLTETDYTIAYATDGAVDSLSHKKGETVVGQNYQATITAVAGGNYKNSLPVNYDIEKLDLASTELVNFTDPTVEYDGLPHVPDVEVSAYKGNKEANGTYKLVKDTDYTIQYRKGNVLIDSVTDIGTYEFQIVAKSDSGYSGASAWTQFEVAAKSIKGADITINGKPASTANDIANHVIDDADWNNGNPSPTIVVRDTTVLSGRDPLELGQDYTVTLLDCNNNSTLPLAAGIGTAVISGMGNYGDSIEVPFVIGKEIKPDWIEITPEGGYVYDTKEHKPTVKVTPEGASTALKVDKNYIITYNGDKIAKDGDLTAAGDKSVTVTGINEYFGSIDVEYSVAKVQPAAGRIRVEMTLDEYDGDDPNITPDSIGKRYYTPYTGDEVEDNNLIKVYYYFGASDTPEYSPLDNDWILLNAENYTVDWNNNQAASIRYKEDGTLEYNTPATVDIKLKKNFVEGANVDGHAQFWILPYDLDVEGETNYKAVLTTSPTGDVVKDTGVYKGETLYYYNYTGNPIKPGVSLYMTDSEGHVIGTVPQNGDKGGYTVTYYADTTNCGLKYATIKCYGNYSGEFTLPYVIWDDFATAADDYTGTCYFDIDVSEPFFTGAKEEAPVVVKHGGVTLTEGKDYTLAYGNWKGSEGAYTGGTVTISAAPDAIWFGNSVSIDYSIETKIENLVFRSVDGTIDTSDTAKINEIGYTGADIRPEIVVETPGGTALEKDVQYTIKWTRADTVTVLNPGDARNPSNSTYYVIVDVDGVGTKGFRYKITGCDVSKNWTATLTSTKWIYTGGERKPNVTVKTKTGDVLTKDTDYTVEYANNINPTTADKKASVTITPKDTTYNTGTLVVNYDIVPSDIPYVNVTGVGVTQATIAWPEVTAPITGYLVYTDGSKVGDKGQARKIVAPSADSKTASCILDNLAQGSSTPVYVQTYLEIDTNNDSIKEIYYGTPKSNTATTKQGQSTISQAANTKNGKVYIDWVSQGGVDGYEIFYSSTADGKYIEKAYVASPLTYASVTMTKGYTYYFKVRSVKIVNGTSVYGEFSEPVAVAVTK